MYICVLKIDTRRNEHNPIGNHTWLGSIMLHLTSAGATLSMCSLISQDETTCLITQS